MLKDSIPIEIATKAYLSTFSNDEKKRREGALKNKDFYYGRQEQYISTINDDVDPITVNLINPIVTKRSSLLYNRKLVREFDGPSQSISYLESIYNKLNIDHLLAKVDLCAELTGTSLVYVGQYEDGEIYLLAYDASEFSAISNELDPNYIEALSLVSVKNDFVDRGGNIDVVRVVHSEVWTENYIYNFVNEANKSSTPNELGFVPFVPFKAQEVNNQFLGHSPSISIRQLNQYLNQVLTNLGYMVKMQAATPIVLTGFANGEGVSVHPGSAISLPAGSSAGALQLNPKITETLELAKYIEDKVYETSSIPKISIIGNVGTSSSGVELMIKWAPLMSIFREKSARYQMYELNLANTILSVAGLDTIDNIKVNYPEDNLLPIDPDREKLETDLKYGIRTPMDEIIKLNPTISETEAEAEVLANLSFNEQLNGGTGVRQQ